MKSFALLLVALLTLASLSNCTTTTTTVQDENEAALDAAMDEQAELERTLSRGY